MSAFSHWLKKVGLANSALNRKSKGCRRACQRKTARRVALNLEELEERVVPSLLGDQLFPADYPWNQNIANAPVASNSAAIISHIGTSVKVHPDWGADSAANGSNPLYGIPYNVVHGNSGSVTKVNVIIDNYPGESDIIAVPMPANPVIEGDYQNGPNPNGGGYNANQRGDSHLIVWDEDNNIAYELYGVTRPSDPKLFPNTNGVELNHTDGLWHAAQESVWTMSADSFRPLGDTSADAAGLSILAGLVRPDEGLPAGQGGQGAIDHALRLTLPSGDVSPQYIYPASHVVNDSAGSTKLPFGARLRLQNTPAVNALINAMQPEAQIIAHAMQQYGLVVADIGSAMFVTGASAAQDANNNISLTWNMNDIVGLGGLTAGNFEVVNLAPVVTGLGATSGSAGSTITITGQNFSGSAGHLSVLFGGVASPSVTFVDDSHVTSVVPAGSGIVNVQVQSGINAVDPNSPSNNVNNPIFGYGISATVAADQFTYTGTQTISPSYSTVSFATSSVAVNSVDTLTIVVKDTTGNPVSGLASGAFSLSLAGGVSAGIFGSVTETATHGSYTANFTGTTAGTASTLTVTVSGVVLTTKPTITVTSQTAASSYQVADFPGYGLYLYNASTGWQSLHSADASRVVVNASGTVAAVFASGLSRYTTATGWQLLTSNANITFLAIDPTGAVVADFTGYGINRYTSATGWQSLHTPHPSLAAVDAAGNIIADFPGYGLDRYTVAGGWQSLTSVDASLLNVDAGGNVVANFTHYGVFRYTSAAGWKNLMSTDASALAVDAAGNIFGAFAGVGVREYNLTTGWQLLSGNSNVAFLSADAAGDVVVDFTGYGLYRYTAAGGWKNLNTHDASLVVVDAAGNITADFPGFGLERYTTSWQIFATPEASKLASGG